MKIENRDGEPRDVDLQSLGATTTAWAELFQRTARLMIEKYKQQSSLPLDSVDNAFPEIHLRVKKIQISSVDLTSEATSETDSLPASFWEAVYSYLRTGFDRMENGSPPEILFPPELRQPARDLITTFSSNGIGRIQFGLNGHLDSQLTWEKSGKLVKSSVKHRSFGSVDGTIESISLATRPKFGLRIAHGNLVSCGFDANKLLEDVTKFLTKRVMVEGVLSRDDAGTLLSVNRVLGITPLRQPLEFGSVTTVFGSWEDIIGGESLTEWTEAQRGK